MKRILQVSLFLLASLLNGQSVTAVYKIGDLLNRICNTDTIYVVNFWATWCKPCIQELPAFDSLEINKPQANVKVILVSLDFSDEIQKKVNPFIAKRKIKSECVLLDEVNGNDFINRISEDWSGAIPATLVKHGNNSVFLEKKTKLAELMAAIKKAG